MHPLGGNVRKSILSATVLGLIGAAVLGGSASASAEEVNDTQGLVTKAAPAGGALRIGGADRYTTSSLISENAWQPEETTVVFLASGENFPDALSLASFGGAGPVLLTARDRLPAAIEAELRRLQPCVVIVAGGEGSISKAVFDRAGQHADPAKCDPA